MSNDAISRQDAIDVEGLDEEIRCQMCKNQMKTDKGCDGNCKYDEKLYEKIIQILNRRIKSLPSAEPKRERIKWIPCSERLPDNDESVLISNSHGVTKAWWTGRSWTSIAVKNYKTVTAWMPLPEPYSEDEE